MAGHPAHRSISIRSSALRIVRKASFCALATLAAAIPAWAPAAQIDRVKAALADPRGLGAPGCAAGAFRDGEPLFFQASGAADVASRRPLTENTLFYAASTSKQFTVLSAARLVEQKKLDLDDDVRKWIPQLPAYEKPITIAMLVHHTAGIRDWLGLAKMAGVQDAGKIDRASALSFVFKQKHTNFTPGAKFDYSNGGYLLLSEVVERASGMPFDRFAKQAVLDPMGMVHSYFVAGARPKGDNVAHGYIAVGDGFEVRDTYPQTGGSGGLITTIADMAKYDRDVQVGHKVWTPTVAKIMLTPGTLNDGSTAAFGAPYHMAYAGGLMAGIRDGRYLFSHAGGAEGFSVNYANLPDRHLGVAVVCNRTDLDAVKKTFAIIDILEETHFLEEAKAADKPKISVEEKYSFLAKPELSGAYVSDELGATYRFAVVKGVTMVTVSSPWADAGSPAANLRFGVEKAAEAKPNRYQLVASDSSGAAYEIVFDGDGRGFTLNGGRAAGLHFKRTDKKG